MEDIKTYKPEYLLDLIDESTLKLILNGFQEHLKMNVVLWYKKRDEEGYALISPNEKEYAVISPIEKYPYEYWSEVCLRFRRGHANDQVREDYILHANNADYIRSVRDQVRKDYIPYDNLCKHADQDILETIFNHHQKVESFVHPCNILGIKDIIVPIRYENTILGVLMAGQFLPKDEEKSEELLEKMCEKFPEKEKELRESFEEEHKRSLKFVDDEEINEYLKKLKGLGNAIANICDIVIRQKIDIRYKEFISYCIDELSKKQPENKTEWIRSLQSYLSAFTNVTMETTTIERVGFFKGAYENGNVTFDLVAMDSNKWWDSTKLLFKEDDFLHYIRVIKQYQKGSLPEPIKKGVGENIADKKFFSVYCFVNSTVESHGEVFSLMVIQSQTALDASLLTFCEDFCEKLCLQDALVRLYFRQTNIFENFRNKVIDIKHDLKSSLQQITDNIEDLKIFGERSPIIKETLSKVTISIGLYNDIINKLEPEIKLKSRPFEKVDVFTLTRMQVDLFKKTASNKGLQISTLNLPQSGAFVVCEPIDLSLAIGNLLDNAIKYSHSSIKSPGRRFIGVSGKIDEEKNAIIKIANYGIGIPPERLNDIKERFNRVGVNDPKRDRAGSGLGLAIASHVIQNILGGSIDIQSDPDPMRDKNELPYHRYITKVIVKIPVKIKE